MDLPTPASFKPLFNWAVDSYDLRSTWDFIRLYHTPGLGYHNLRHLETVAGVAVHLALVSGNVDPRQALIAGMFHDFRHTGRGDDQVNVRLAVDSLCDIYREEPRLLRVSESEFTDICYAIKSTQYDSSALEFPNDPKSLLSYILRDSDVWTPHLDPKEASLHIEGLRLEMGLTMIPSETWFEENLKFYNRLQWYTPLGRSLVPLIDHNMTLIKVQALGNARCPEHYRT